MFSVRRHISTNTQKYSQYAEIFSVHRNILNTQKYSQYAEIFSVRRNILSTQKYSQYAEIFSVRRNILSTQDLSKHACSRVECGLRLWTTHFRRPCGVYLNMTESHSAANFCSKCGFCLEQNFCFCPKCGNEIKNNASVPTVRSETSTSSSRSRFSLPSFSLPRFGVFKAISHERNGATKFIYQKEYEQEQEKKKG